jgi:flagellar biosynthetic protein FlhB
MLRPMGGPLVALGAMAVGAAVVGRVLTGGFDFNASLWSFKGSRIDPVAGLKRIFGVRGLIELVKALLKTVLLIGLSAWLLGRELDTLAGLSAMRFDDALATVGAVGIRLVLWLSLGLVVIAGGDLPVQIVQWLQRLRMTRQEVREEMKQQEASPELRNAIRRMARENMKRASRGAMAEATVVLTNPTHFAVALRYRPGADSAPVIVARGRGLMAEVIRELAAEQKTMILSYPSVARAIYFTGKVGAMIRPDLYAAVAAILAFVLRVGAEMADADSEPPVVEAPETALFDENGRMVPAVGG